MDCSPPDSSVHRILQARILEWVVCPNIHYPSATTATGFWQEQTLYCVTPPSGVNQDDGCSRIGLTHLLCCYRLGGRSPEGPASVLYWLLSICCGLRVTVKSLSTKPPRPVKKQKPGRWDFSGNVQVTFLSVFPLCILQIKGLYCLGKLQEIVEDRGTWWATVHGVENSRTRQSNWTTTAVFHKPQSPLTPKVASLNRGIKLKLVKTGLKIWEVDREDGCLQKEQNELGASSISRFKVSHVSVNKWINIYDVPKVTQPVSQGWDSIPGRWLRLLETSEQYCRLESRLSPSMCLPGHCSHQNGRIYCLSLPHDSKHIVSLPIDLFSIDSH